MKAEKLWNDWFTVNAITKTNAFSEKETTPSDATKSMKLPRAPESVLKVECKQSERQARTARKYEGNQPIKSLENQARKRNRKIIAANISQADKMSKFTQIATSEIIEKLNDSYLPANYQADKMLQKVISLVKSREGAKISRLPAPWREKFNSLSIDERGFLYMDEGLVIPASLRASILISVHYGHPGRNTMLRYISDIWWPKIHREVINTAKCCEQCSLAGKNVKPLKRQNQFGEIPKSVEPNEEIALDFAGHFQNAEHGKKYMLVAIDNYSAWPDALFLHKPSTKNVIEFLKNYIAQYGIMKQIRTDLGTAFTSEKFKAFCNQFQIKHITCPVRDHRGNGKIERLIRTINERLRTNKNIVPKREKSRLSEILYALRTGQKADGKSPFEKLYGRQTNTVKSNVVERIKNVSETEPKVAFSPSDFEEEIDSTILVRKRTKGSKLEGQYKRKAGEVIKETERTITFLPKKSEKEVILSKRYVAKDTAEKEKAGTSRQRESPEWPTEEETSDDETYIRPESEDDEETTITSNSENVITEEEEDSTAKIEEEERPAEKNEAEEKKKTEPEKTSNPKRMENPREKTEEKKKAMKATMEWTPANNKEPRKRRPTQRYGIDVVMQVEENESLETEKKD